MQAAQASTTAPSQCITGAQLPSKVHPTQQQHTPFTACELSAKRGSRSLFAEIHWCRLHDGVGPLLEQLTRFKLSPACLVGRVIHPSDALPVETAQVESIFRLVTTAVLS